VDFKRAISEKEFLPDLHDPLGEGVLEVPPLRAQREDISLLVEHFVAVHSRWHGVEVRGASREDLARAPAQSLAGERPRARERDQPRGGSALCVGRCAAGGARG
jgi:DNA-binding NtrC family response regulator